MLEAWANTIVICAIGGAIGATGTFMTHIVPQSYREATESSAREGEGFWQAARRRSDKGSEIMGTPEGRPARITASALYGLILVLVLTVWLSPVHLGWWTLVISVVLGGCLVELLYYLARTHRLLPSGRSFLDPLG